jgi:WW domain-binding protein 11
MAKGSNRNLNPADKQRKLERKKELKKHKKQRVEVRKAVLKSKDTDSLLDQMRQIDAMGGQADFV